MYYLIRRYNMARYESAKELYAKFGIDTEEALRKLSNITVSVHCWQGDDVGGFDGDDAPSGGIQTTGNYPGKARNPEELMADIDKAFSLIPGKKKLNLHACYAIFDGNRADRDALRPSISQSGSSLQKKEISVLISIPHSSHTPW